MRRENNLVASQTQKETQSIFVDNYENVIIYDYLRRINN